MNKAASEEEDLESLIMQRRGLTVQHQSLPFNAIMDSPPNQS